MNFNNKNYNETSQLGEKRLALPVIKRGCHTVRLNNILNNNIYRFWKSPIHLYNKILELARPGLVLTICTCVCACAVISKLKRWDAIFDEKYHFQSLSIRTSYQWVAALSTELQRLRNNFVYLLFCKIFSVVTFCRKSKHHGMQTPNI